MRWCQFVMDLGALSPDCVEEIFSRHGVHAVSLCAAGNDAVLEPAPGEVALWPDSRIAGLFSADTDLDSLKQDLLSSLDLRDLPRHTVEKLADRPWEREWLKDFGPMRFGDRLWVAPGGCDIEQEGAIVVRLDPGLAFGTGTHPTTALCLKWLEGLQISGKTILDYGCGSGILAIAALLLGARSANALDIDRQAVTATAENARKNDVTNRLFVTQDVAALTGSFDIVVANILAEPLVSNAPQISQKIIAGGVLALSGILDSQAQTVRDAYREYVEFELPTIDHTTDQSWVLLAGRRL